MPILKLKVLDANGNMLSESRPGERVSLVHSAAYAPGDRITLETECPGLFCVVQLEDSMPPALVFVRGTGADFPVPPAGNRPNYSPKSFTGGKHRICARTAEDAEIEARRNLALNPYDTHGEHGLYPHASANVETRGEAVFAARNAIDGIYENSCHGEWPYQSWGINRDPEARLKLSFGRPVTVDEARLTLRADYPHDSHWTRATLAFSDGGSETFSLTDSAAPQTFSFAPHMVEWAELRDLVKAEDESPFPALTQLELWGTEAEKKK